MCCAPATSVACKPPAAATDSHAGHEHGSHEHEGDSCSEGGICPEHNVPGDECGICNPEKIAGLKPGESLPDLMLTAPQPPAVPPPSPRARPATKRPDNYLLPPEELYLPTLEENFKPPQLTEDGRDVKSLSPMERALRDSYDRSRNPLLTNQPGFGPGRGGLLGGNPILRPAQPNAFQRTLGTEADSSAAKLREAMEAREMFGLGGGFGGPKLTPLELQRRNQMMELYNPNYTRPEPGALPAPGVFSTPYVDSSFYDPPKAAAVAPAPAPVAVAPTVNFSPAFAPPPEPSRAAALPAPATPFVTVPRRNF